MEQNRNDSTSQVFDPLRRRNVALTPEERVRQWFIGILSKEMCVPSHMMMSEVAIHLGGKKFRADILVYDRELKPLAVVECKRPDVSLDRPVLEQALRYNIVLNVSYIIITNGLKTYAFHRTETGFEMMQNLPLWENMAGNGPDEPSK